jgi:hypothetical protein
MKNSKLLFLIILGTMLVLLGFLIRYLYSQKMDQQTQKDLINKINFLKSDKNFAAIANLDVTSKVQIHCGFKDKKVVVASTTDLKFVRGDFDQYGNFTNYSMNLKLQDVCGISDKEVMKIANDPNRKVESIFDLINVELVE